MFKPNWGKIFISGFSSGTISIVSGLAVGVVLGGILGGTAGALLPFAPIIGAVPGAMGGALLGGIAGAVVSFSTSFIWSAANEYSNQRRIYKATQEDLTINVEAADPSKNNEKARDLELVLVHGLAKGFYCLTAGAAFGAVVGAIGGSMVFPIIGTVVGAPLCAIVAMCFAGTVGIFGGMLEELWVLRKQRSAKAEAIQNRPKEESAKGDVIDVIDVEKKDLPLEDKYHHDQHAAEKNPPCPDKKRTYTNDNANTNLKNTKK
jgi:hypothetical protein